MDWDILYRHAIGIGFADCFCVSAYSFEKWNAVPKDARWASLKADVTAEYPWAKCIIVLVWAYKPYDPLCEGNVKLDAYYPASQRAYTAAGELALYLQENGIKATHTQDIPCKPALVRTGKARYGRNGLTSIEGLGTYFVIQTVIIDQDFPAAHDEQPILGFSDTCNGCTNCVEACPVKAISPDGKIDPNKCLRGYSYSSVLPVELRVNVSVLLFGCGICQKVCPRNKAIGYTPVPMELSAMLDIGKLLAGDIDGLPEIIGKNYAIKNRIIARAVLIAVKLRRVDLLPEIKKLTLHASPLIREYALWATEELRDN